ncbi:hypothetical protein JTB14_020865 [Gonioctena quinquepunctata]|nr:hypothetical protein JTB14_020865 [Gonioctena quinquepunctata]
MGDLNAQHEAWGSTNNNVRGRNLMISLNKNNVTFLNDGRPTRITLPGQGNSCPDITICSPDLATLCHWNVLESPGMIDHLPTTTSINRNIDHQFKNKPISRWNTKKADWQRYNTELAEVHQEMNYKEWTEKLTNAANYSYTKNEHNSRKEDVCGKTMLVGRRMQRAIQTTRDCIKGVQKSSDR